MRHSTTACGHVFFAQPCAACPCLADNSMLRLNKPPARLRAASACLLQGPLKKWEHYKLTANGKPVRLPMPMKTGDTVKIIAGSDKGKVGKITKVGLTQMCCAGAAHNHRFVEVCLHTVPVLNPFIPVHAQVVTKMGQIIVEGVNVKVRFCTAGSVNSVGIYRIAAQWANGNQEREIYRCCN